MNIDRLLKSANKKLNNGNSAGAREIYEDILRKYPKNSRAIAALKKYRTDLNEKRRQF